MSFLPLVLIFLCASIIALGAFNDTKKRKKVEHQKKLEEQQAEQKETRLCQQALTEIEDAAAILKVESSACRTGYIAYYMDKESKRKSALFGMGD